MDTDVKVQGLKYKVMATGEFDKSQEKSTIVQPKNFERLPENLLIYDGY